MITDNINANEITRWVLQMLYLPHINPYHIIKTNNALVMVLRRNIENKKTNQ